MTGKLTSCQSERRPPPPRSNTPMAPLRVSISGCLTRSTTLQKRLRDGSWELPCTRVSRGCWKEKGAVPFTEQTSKGCSEDCSRKGGSDEEASCRSGYGSRGLRRKGCEGRGKPGQGQDVWIGVDVSRSKWVYKVRWGGREQRGLSTPGELHHLQALVGEFNTLSWSNPCPARPATDPSGDA